MSKIIEKGLGKVKGYVLRYVKGQRIGPGEILVRSTFPCVYFYIELKQPGIGGHYKECNSHT